MNRIQAMVIAFFIFVLLSLAAVLFVQPEIYDRQLRLLPTQPVVGRGIFLVAVASIISLPVVGVIRRWRWTFWVVLIAFLTGALRIPYAALELFAVVPTTDPAWFVAVQGMIGVVQLVVGLLLLRAFRRTGCWGVAGRIDG